MLDIRYQGLRLIPSRSAMREMMKLGLAIEDCKAMLEQGNDAPRKRWQIVRRSGSTWARRPTMSLW